MQVSWFIALRSLLSYYMWFFFFFFCFFLCSCITPINSCCFIFHILSVYCLSFLFFSPVNPLSVWNTFAWYVYVCARAIKKLLYFYFCLFDWNRNIRSYHIAHFNLQSIFVLFFLSVQKLRWLDCFFFHSNVLIRQHFDLKANWNIIMMNAGRSTFFRIRYNKNKIAIKNTYKHFVEFCP